MQIAPDVAKRPIRAAMGTLSPVVPRDAQRFIFVKVFYMGTAKRQQGSDVRVEPHSDAFMKIKIDADFVGFYHLFALEGNELTLTGTMISSQIGTSAASFSHVCEVALRHCKSLSGFGVIDYFKLMHPKQQTFDAAKMDEYFRRIIEE